MRKLTLDEFTKYKFLSGIEWSPTTRKACYVMHQANVEDNKYSSNLCLYDADTEKHLRLTTFDNESNYLWLEDGENIIFSSIRDDKDKERITQGETLTQYYRININGGEAQKYFNIPLRLTSIKQLDTDNFIFTAMYNPMHKDLSTLTSEEKSKELKRRKEEKDYEVIDEIPFWSNGGGYTNKKRNRLYTYNITDNKYKAITDELSNIQSVNINDDKSKVIFLAVTYTDKYPLTNNIFIYDIKSKKVEKLMDNEEFSCSYVNFVDDDNIIFLGSDMKHHGNNENKKFFSMNIISKEIECINADVDITIGNTVGSDCRYGASVSIKKHGDLFYFTTTENDSAYLNRLDIKNGTIEKIVTDKGSVDSFTIKGNDVLFIGLRDTKLQEIYKVVNDAEVQVSNYNTWVNDEVTLSSYQRLTVETEPGVFIDGWVLAPVDFDKNRKYPAILDIHGGPKTVYGEVFYHEMQYWANEGYFVFFCNPRGSDGKGNKFADIRGKYGTIDYVDLMRFTDEVLERYPNIDSNRLGVTGGSYGGFMTNWIVGHTDRFKAAASQRSISNWISMFGTTDIGYFFAEDQIGTNPWEDADKLWWHSPVRYADKVKTPTLLLHSDEDYRCWIVEAYQMFTALKYHGVESRLCMFRGENHELSRSGKPKHRIRRLEEITNWFNKYLKN